MNDNMRPWFSGIGVRRVRHSEDVPGATTGGCDTWRFLAWILFAVLALVIAVTFRDYGISWDEEHSAANGEYALAWYRSFGADDRVITGYHQKLYGSLYNILVQLVSLVLPFAFYDTDHLLSAVTGWIAVLATYAAGRRLAGSRCGFLSALALLLTPAFLGHMFMNPKDIPFAALFAVSMAALLKADDELPKPRFGTLVALGLSAGCAAGVRVLGTFVLGYWALAIALWRLGEIGADGSGPKWSRVFMWWVVPAVVAWGTMVAFWPFAQLDPLRNPVEAFLENSKFPWLGAVFFEGKRVAATDLPATYLPTWFAISLPEFYAAGLGFGALSMVLSMFSVQTNDRARAWRRFGIVALAAGFPVAAAVASRAVVYDGMRHFLFTLPLLALLVGAGLSSAWEFNWPAGNAGEGISKFLGALGGLVVLFAAASMALTVCDVAGLHPYEYVYFNRTVAGGQVEGASRYETDYWGISYREALAWLREHYPVPPTGPLRLENCSKEYLTGFWIARDDELRRRFVSVPSHTSSDILLATTRNDCHKQEGKVLHVVERAGVPLCYVIERPRPKARAVLR